MKTLNIIILNVLLVTTSVQANSTIESRIINSDTSLKKMFLPQDNMEFSNAIVYDKKKDGKLSVKCKINLIENKDVTPKFADPTEQSESIAKSLKKIRACSNEEIIQVEQIVPTFSNQVQFAAIQGPAIYGAMAAVATCAWTGTAGVHIGRGLSGENYYYTGGQITSNATITVGAVIIDLVYMANTKVPNTPLMAAAAVVCGSVGGGIGLVIGYFNR